MYHDLPPGESDAAVERERRRRPDAAAPAVGKPRRRRRSDIAVSAGAGGRRSQRGEGFLLLSVLGGSAHVDWVCTAYHGVAGWTPKAAWTCSSGYSTVKTQRSVTVVQRGQSTERKFPYRETAARLCKKREL
jgi:hypothetical protein